MMTKLLQLAIGVLCLAALSYAQSQANGLTATGVVDLTGTTSFIPPFTGSQPSGNCASVGAGAQKTYIATGISSIYTCTPSTGTTCGTCTWQQTSSGGGGGGSVAIQASGSAVGTRSTLDFVQGSGISQTVTDTGSKITIQTDIGPAVQTKATAQSGSHLLCSAANTTTLTCAMSPTLSAYTDKMLVNLCVSGAVTGATTLNVDTLGAKSVLTFTGSNPSTGDLATGCRIATYQSSDNSFRLPGGTGASLSTTAVMDLHIGGCDATVARTLWGVYGGAVGGCTGPSSTIPGIIFSNSGSNGAVWYGYLAEDWNGGNTTLVLRPANGSNAAGTVKYILQTHCLAAGDNLGPIGWDTVGSQSYTEGSNGTFGSDVAFTAALSGCSAGNWFGVFLSRDGSVGGNSNGNSWIVGAKLKYTRQ
jgi:hypothetical protein